MAQMTFYRQRRRDGGTRTGIDLNSFEYWHRFQPGSDEDDPSLEWYVEVRVEGEGLPTEADEARDWFRRHTALLQEALRVVAERLEVGLDGEGDGWPLLWSLPNPPAGTAVVIAVSALRRITTRQIGQILLETADQMDALIANLERMYEIA